MVKCDKCGEENTSTAIRCKSCGKPFNSKKGSSNMKIIAIVAIIVVIAIVGVFASGMLSNNTSVQSDAQVVAPQQQSNVQNNTSNVATNNNSEPTTYVASAKTDKFHRPDCEWAQKITDSNKITYSSRNEAISSGKTPCSVCNP